MGYCEHEYSNYIINSRIYEIEYNKIPFGCWINLNGIVYKTHYAEHCILAHKILNIEFKERIDDEIEFEDNGRLIKKGWILVQKIGTVSDTYYINVKKISLVNPKQHETISKIKTEFEKKNKIIGFYEWDSLK